MKMFMKNYCCKISAQNYKLVVFSILIILVCNTLNAQLATFPLQSPRTANGNTPEGEARRPLGTDPNVVTGVNAPLPSLYQISDGPYNATGYRVKTRVAGTGVPWPTSINDNFGFDIPIKPAAGFDMNITSIRFKDTTLTLNNGGIFTIVPYFQVDGVGPFVLMAGATPQTVSTANTLVSFGPLNETFYSGHNYIVRFYVFNSDGSTNGRNDEMRICNLVFNGTLTTPPAVAPTVTTTSATTTGLYSANVVGSYQSGTGFHTVYQSGLVWGTSTNPTVPANSYNTSGSGGSTSGSITGLTAGTTYHVRSYIITQFGTFYGADLTFTTAPPAIPTLVTDPVTNIQSNKATSGGSSIDSSGAYIFEKGLVWSTSNNPTITLYPGGNKGIFSSGGSLSFSDLMKQLLPNTTYYVRAYAINSVGVGYGVVRQFTTGAPAPTLTAIPGKLDFTGSLGGANPIVLFYTLSGSLLNPASGNITVTAQAPFLISLTGAAGSFASSVAVPYISSQLVNVPIYVQLPTNNLGSFSGYILHTGGGVSTANADTVFLSGVVEQSPDAVTNRGTDFWLGFGYQENMEEPAGDPQEAMLSLYISAGDQPATVVVALPGVPGAATFPRTVNIPANSVVEVTGFPTGDPNDELNPMGMPDVRLFTTGISNKGIHVYSTNGAEVSVWMYTYAPNNSAAGAMVFPTATWNSSYTVQGYGGKSNVSGPPNSFFYVIASEDNTEVIFTPSQPVVAANANTIFGDNHTAADILYPAGVTDTIVLNRGQVFNAMGFVQGSGSNNALGLDLSGTTVRTNCDKKIAVFAGNGRCLVTTPSLCTAPTSGSDNLVQQMIPQVAWGTKYLTVPTKTMEHNLFRIYKQDPAATVALTINGAAQTITPAELYKVIESNAPMVITSDKPISVTQFIIAGQCASGGGANASGNNGFGDPEMIILSAAQQAINNVSVYSPNFKNAPSASGSYLNVVIKTGGISSFKLDLATNPTQMVDTGASSFTGNSFGTSALIPIANAFKPFASDPTYSWAKFKVATGAQHRMQSDSGFNAIAYGMGGGESYGFNAGTAVKNLNSIKISVNPNGQDSSTSAVRTCIGNQVKLKIALPYNPFLVDSIVWYPQTPNDPLIEAPGNGRNKGALDGASPQKAKYIRSFVIDGRTFYEYESPTFYVFKALGTFVIVANAFGTFASDCPGEDRQKIPVIVGRDNINFTYSSSCGSPVVTFTNNTLPMAGSTISSLKWEFGDGRDSTNDVNPIVHDYTATQNITLYTVKLSTVNSYGCNSSDVLQVDISGGIKPKFSIAPTKTICSGTQLTFDPAQSQVTGVTAGNPVKWTWNFGAGEGADVVINGSSSPVQNHLFTSSGLKEITLRLETSTGCFGVYKDTVTVEAKPVAAINTNPTFVCFGDSAAYLDASTISIGTITSWEWLFDDGTTSALQNPKHKWLTAGNHTTKLVVRSTGSCASDTATHIINVNPLPKAGFRYDLDCTTRTLTLTDTSNGFGTNITAWEWDFGDLSPKSTQQNPVHVYAASGTYTITLIVTTANGCRNAIPESVTVTIAASPVADFTVPGATCLPGATPVFANNTTISDGTIGLVTYIWNFGETPSVDYNAPAQIPVSPTHLYADTGTYTVKLTAISDKGCTHSVTKTYRDIYKKPVAVITAPTGVCLGNATNFSSALSTAPGSTVSGWSWDFGDSPAPGSSTDQNPTYTYTGSGPRTVTLTVTNGAGCSSDPVNANFSVNLSPVGGFTFDAIRCEDSLITFTDASTPNGAAITEWKWDFGGDGLLTQTTLAPATHTFSNSSSYNVSLVVKDANGCSDGSPFVLPVVINPNPLPDFDVTDICVGSGLANFTQNVSIATGQIAIWDWDFGVTGALPGSGATPSFTYTSGGEYNVTLTAISDSSCRAVKTKIVKAFTAPTAALDVNNPSTLCSNLPVGIIDRSVVTGYGAVDKLEIYWDNLGAPSSKQTINAPSANATYTNAYPLFGTPATKPYQVMIRAFNGPGCSTDITQNITVLASPRAQFTQPAPICQEAPSFALTGGSDAFNLPGSGAYNGNGVSGTDFSPLFAGAGTHDITYTYTADNGCIDDTVQSIVVHPTPVINFGNQPQINVLEGDILQLKPTITNGASYLWLPSDYFITGNNIASPSALPKDDIIYTLQVTSAKGCMAAKSINVKVVRNYIVPNTFTPNNGDNFHDKWEIPNLVYYPDVRVRVFSRSGQMVFESYGYNTPWDGKYKGQDCPFGTYYYVIETGGGRKPRTGYVTIIR